MCMNIYIKLIETSNFSFFIFLYILLTYFINFLIKLKTDKNKNYNKTKQ